LVEISDWGFDHAVADRDADQPGVGNRERCIRDLLSARLYRFVRSLTMEHNNDNTIEKFKGLQRDRLCAFLRDRQDAASRAQRRSPSLSQSHYIARTERYQTQIN
jgi:hypothetical protein